MCYPTDWQFGGPNHRPGMFAQTSGMILVSKWVDGGARGFRTYSYSCPSEQDYAKSSSWLLILRAGQAASQPQLCSGSSTFEFILSFFQKWPETYQVGGKL